MDSKSLSEKRSVISVVLVLLLLSSSFLSGCTENSDKNLQSTPEETFDKFVERVNKGDGEGVVELLDSSFFDTEGSEQFESSFIDQTNRKTIYVEDYEILTVNYRDEMSQENRSIMENITEFIDENSTVTVDDQCLLKLEWTLSSNGGTETDTIQYPMVKVDSKWYIALYSMSPSVTGSNQ